MLKSVERRLKHRIKATFPTVLYSYPRSHLAPERLWLYLDSLLNTSDLPGAVIEVGCAEGGTASLAVRLLRNQNIDRQYVCVDTFDGFVPAQFKTDLSHGTPEDLGSSFKGITPKMVTHLLRHWGTPEVVLVQSDIVDYPADLLPEQVAVCLVDVDLDIPVSAALEKIAPRLVRGGVLLVDDCAHADYRGARVAYERYMRTHGLEPVYEMGMGVFARPK